MLKPYQEKVIDYKQEVDENIEALRLFFNTDIYQSMPVRDKYLLVEQSGAMANLSRILGDRISRFIQDEGNE